MDQYLHLVEGISNHSQNTGRTVHQQMYHGRSGAAPPSSVPHLSKASGGDGAANEHQLSFASQNLNYSSMNRVPSSHSASREHQSSGGDSQYCNYAIVNLIGLSLYEIAQIIIKERKSAEVASQSAQKSQMSQLSQILSHKDQQRVNSKFDSQTLSVSNKYRSLNLNSISSGNQGSYQSGVGNLSTINNHR